MPYRIFLPKTKKRSKILSITSLLAINIFLLVAIILRLVSLYYVDFHILGFATNINISRLLDQTNIQRSQHNLSPLKYNITLEKAAKNKATNMFALNYWAHIAPNGKTPWDFINEAGYSYTYAGENLAKDFDESDNVVKAWMNSPTHRENILNPNYTEIGFAIQNGTLSGEDTTLVVQMFGTPSNSSKSTEKTPLVTSQSQKTLSVESNVQQPSAEIAVVDTQNTSTDKNYITVETVYIRWFLYTLIVFFTAALSIDGLLAYKKQYKRLTGNTISHIFFLLFILLILIYLSKGGVI